MTLPVEIENIIYDYKYQLDKEEHKNKFKNVLNQFESVIDQSEECMCSCYYNNGNEELNDDIYYKLRENQITEYILSCLDDINNRNFVIITIR